MIGTLYFKLDDVVSQSETTRLEGKIVAQHHYFHSSNNPRALHGTTEENHGGVVAKGTAPIFTSVDFYCGTKENLALDSWAKA